MLCISIRQGTITFTRHRRFSVLTRLPSTACSRRRLSLFRCHLHTVPLFWTTRLMFSALASTSAVRTSLCFVFVMQNVQTNMYRLTESKRHVCYCLEFQCCQCIAHCKGKLVHFIQEYKTLALIFLNIGARTGE
jgi:hypothetical protein